MGFQKDKKGESFILSMQPKQKMTLSNFDQAILCSSSTGPSFGLDLVINGA